MNPTITGAFAVLVWGFSLPICRLVEAQIGVPATVGILFSGAGLLGLIQLRLSHKPLLPPKKILKNPNFYGRWLFFVLHEALVMTAICLVSKENVPFVILLNYLWPTAIILCSVLFAGVAVTRWWAFGLGTLIVIGSLCLEIIDPKTGTHIFAQPQDQLAYSLAFIDAISWGLYCAFSKRGGDSAGGGDVIPLFQLSLGLVLPISIFSGHITNLALPPAPAVILGAWCFLQFLAAKVWDSGMRKGNIVILSLCADFIPWLSLAAASLIVKAEISPLTIVSAITLVAGAMITRYGTIAQKKFQPKITLETEESSHAKLATAAITEK
jgi:drug/metabolite transporter (DMT)-like permease